VLIHNIYIIYITATWTNTEAPGVPMPQHAEFVQVSLWDKVKSGAKKLGNSVQNTVQQAKKIANNAVQEAKSAGNTVVNKAKSLLPSGPLLSVYKRKFA
jgi:hypothetical protein